MHILFRNFIFPCMLFGDEVPEKDARARFFGEMGLHPLLNHWAIAPSSLPRDMPGWGIAPFQPPGLRLRHIPKVHPS